MSIDEQATIQSILLALKVEGVKTADVARQIQGISEKPFRNALKTAGYEFSNKAPKGWHFVGKGEQPLNKSIFDYVKKSSPNKKRSSQVVHQQFTSSNTEFTQSNIEVITDSPVVHPQFTHDEVHMIKDMLVEWQRVIRQGATQEHEIQIDSEHDLNLHDRIKQLKQDDKTRKTIVIDKTIGEQLDSFCKAERVNKSDVLHIALLDFLERYSE